jgi:hypothetical protein
VCGQHGKCCLPRGQQCSQLVNTMQQLMRVLCRAGGERDGAGGMETDIQTRVWRLVTHPVSHNAMYTSMGLGPVRPSPCNAYRTASCPQSPPDNPIPCYACIPSIPAPPSGSSGCPSSNSAHIMGANTLSGVTHLRQCGPGGCLCPYGPHHLPRHPSS